MKKIVLTNDIDHGSLERYKIIYDALNQNNLLVDTALFCKIEDDGSKLAAHCNKHDTVSLEDTEFLAFVKDMISCGHNFSYHGYSQVSNNRQKFLDGIKIFEDLLGFKPRTYIEHGGKYGHHDDQMVKKETLAYLGSNKESEFYVKDIIKEHFDMVWTHDYLIEKNTSYSSSEVFTEKDGIIYFNRVKNVNLLENIDKLDVLIGYTHFGYDGYSIPKYDWIPFFKSNNRRLETWANKQQTHDALKILKSLSNEKKVVFSTLNQIYDQHYSS